MAQGIAASSPFQYSGESSELLTSESCMETDVQLLLHESLIL